MSCTNRWFAAFLLHRAEHLTGLSPIQDGVPWTLQINDLRAGTWSARAESMFLRVCAGNMLR
jgi:hypothetical protein